MENASQALIIAGTILVALLVLSVGVYLVISYSKVGESYEQSQITDADVKFNTNFTKLSNRTDILAQEIITIKNFAENYDKQNSTTTKVEYPQKALYTVSSGTVEREKKQAEKDAEFIKDFSTIIVTKSGKKEVQMQYFTCTKCEDTNGDGRIDLIEFKKN